MRETLTRFLIGLTVGYLLTTALLAIARGDTEPFFAPGKDPQKELLQAISKARYSILVLAYNFTDPEIAKALVAKGKPEMGSGVIHCDIHVLLDKTASTQKWCQGPLLKAEGIDVRVDGKHPIAHNKVFLIDALDPPGVTNLNAGVTPGKWAIVYTGSYNYSVNAQQNGENLLKVWNEPETTHAYWLDFMSHWNHSDPYNPKIVNPIPEPHPSPAPRKPPRRARLVDHPPRKDAFPFPEFVTPDLQLTPVK